MISNYFDSDFIWGVSSSAYQTEGAYLTDGKGLSIWDVFCKEERKIFQNQNAEMACDFYNRYLHDLILMDYLGLKNFRYSISWPRVLPNGIGKVNEKGIDFYNRLIDGCLELGITPWFTLYHWDLPFALELKGGWTNRDILNWFEEYVTLCMNRFGDRVKHWMVLNEPLVFTGVGYFLGMHAPGKKGLNNFLAAAHHAVLCQSLGGSLLKDHDKNFEVGTTFSASPVDPLNDGKLNQTAALKLDALINRMFIEPALGMGYPTEDIKILQQMEKFIIDGDEKKMKFDFDFIGIQNYTREVVKYNSLMPYVSASIINANKRSVSTTAMEWEIYPEGIYRILKKFASYKNIPKIIITENGAAFEDQLEDGKILDHERVQYLQDYIAQVQKAKKEGVPVHGYFTWSFTDNFEWTEGYRPRFGLVYVDFKTQRRYIKASGHWMKKFLQHSRNEVMMIS